MRKYFVLTFVLTFVSICYGQGYFDKWYFGNGAVVNFTLGGVTSTNGSLHTEEGCASLSNYAGNLLFYTDGDTVWNKNGVRMLNGTGLMGHTSSTQSAVIAPVPGDSNKYYVFTMQDWLSNGDLRYSMVDMTLNSGLGDVLPSVKNILIQSDFTEKMVLADGNCGTWVITHKRNTNEFYSYFIDTSGVNSPVISGAGSIHGPSSMTGTMKISPNNQQLALATLDGIVELFNFNASTGIISGSLVSLPVTPGFQSYGICFSPNSNLLYVGEGKVGLSNANVVYQYDLSSGVSSTIIASKTLVGNPSTPAIIVFDLQIGPDDKIYVTRPRTSYIDIIANPNNLGAACNYISGGLDFGVDIVTVGLPNAVKIHININNTFLGNDTTLCQGELLNLSPIGIWNSYQWSNGSSFPIIPVSSPGLYWVQVSDGYCVFNDSINVTYNSIPIVDLGNDTTLCVGEILDIDVTGSGNTYLWQDGSSDSVYSCSQSGIYWIEVSLNNCIGTDSINVTYNAIPTVDLGNDTSLCVGEILDIDATGSGNMYLWQDGTTNSIYSCSLPGTYWVEVSLNNCIGMDSINVIYNPIPAVDLGNDTALCDGEIFDIDATGSGSSYLWQDSSTNSLFPCSLPGTYWVEVNLNNCIGADSINIIYNSIPLVDLGNDTTLCVGEILAIDATGLGNMYLWQDGSSNSVYSCSLPGTFWVEVNLNNCIGADSINVTYNAIPIVDLGNDTSLCVGEILDIDATGSGNTYLWQDGSSNSVYACSQAGTYWVEVSLNNCIGIDSIDVTYNSIPTFDLGSDTILCLGEILGIDITGSGNSYVWQDGSTNSVYSLSQPGTYWVEVETMCGYIGDSIQINYTDCSCNLFIPSAFTPNDDKLNDDFAAISNCRYTEFEMQIFDRWGEIIFETNNSENHWDGTKNNIILPIGVYVYKLSYKFDTPYSNKEIYIGKVSLVH